MAKFDHKYSMPRYRIIAWLMVVLGISVVGRAAYIMTFQGKYWTEVSDRQKADSVPVLPRRGNIFSSDGQLLSSSLPEYMLYMDFRTLHDTKTDTLWDEKEDSICMMLNRIFPSRSKEEFRADLRKGLEQKGKDKDGNPTVGSRNWKIWPYRVNYSTYAEVKELPIFRLNPYRGGFHVEEFNSRQRPYGSLAKRTIGEMYGMKDSARSGLEMAYDSVLRGQKGLNNRRKVLNKYLDIPIRLPVDGADVVTTIDVNIQDLAERALMDELQKPEVNGVMGVALVMEVETGDIKAMVNLTRGEDGKYYEMQNNAVGYRCEPGSVFKPASILVALDDGVVDTSYVIHTGCGIREMHGRPMKDHNWRNGGYGDINVARSLEVSSNIGVSHVIDHFYGAHPEKFVEGIYRVGMHEDLQVDIPGYHHPMIRKPGSQEKGMYWSKTTLAWMSIGYETQIAPINTLAFYNAVANDGKMMRPRIVKQIVKDGNVIKEFPPVVQKERIAKLSSVKTLQTVLTHVVSQGLGKKAGSKKFSVAGKTGTAQVAYGTGGYKTGTVGYWLSFAGYFPADKPKYSCIVCIKKFGLPASGGGMSGVVFHHIAEGIMAKNLKTHVSVSHDEHAEATPEVKNGNMLAADYVLNNLGISTNGGWNGSYATGNPIWGQASKTNKTVYLTRNGTPSKQVVPDVRGMGARDAVYLLESRGVKVSIHGCGHVKKQSIAPNTKIKKGMRIQLELA